MVVEEHYDSMVSGDVFCVHGSIAEELDYQLGCFLSDIGTFRCDAI